MLSEMDQAMKPKLPIGYWLKQVDNLLTERINETHAAHGVTRSDWQVLATLQDAGSLSKDRLFETMQTFVDTTGFDKILASLMERGWVEQGEDLQTGAAELYLTEEGRRQHEVLFAAQREVRRRAMHGISEEEYATVIRVLQQMVSNLREESAASG
jgi:DNA-binding MarR family transcriptional regulator